MKAFLFGPKIATCCTKKSAFDAGGCHGIAQELEQTSQGRLQHWTPDTDRGCVALELHVSCGGYSHLRWPKYCFAFLLEIAMDARSTGIVQHRPGSTQSAQTGYPAGLDSDRSRQVFQKDDLDVVRWSATTWPLVDLLNHLSRRLVDLSTCGHF